MTKNSDISKWANTGNKELYQIAIEWAKKYTLKQSRAFQKQYTELQGKNGLTETEYLSLQNRWQCVTWAIDYRVFELKKYS